MNQQNKPIEHFSLQDWQTISLAKKNIEYYRQKQFFGEEYQKSIRLVKRLEEKKEKFGISPELQEVFECWVKIKEAQEETNKAIMKYRKKFNLLPPPKPDGGQPIKKENGEFLNPKNKKDS